MTIEIFKGGELYRTDFLILGTIDASKTTYSAEEKGIILKCLAEMPKSLRKFDGACISREFHTKGKIAYYNRSVLHIETGDKEIKGLINAFNHLINIAQDEGDYNYIENFE